MSRLAVYLLGPPRIELDGKPVHISRRKVIALLAYLAVTGTPHSRDFLATLLWPECSQSRARAYLRRALSELNRTLGEGFLTIDRETAGVDPNADLSLDVTLFRQLLAEGETHDHPTMQVCSDCVTGLEEAVELYCDDFMVGFTLRDSPDFDEWQFFQCENLRDELASALERLMRWHSSQREYDRAIAYARRWLALDPLHEPVHRHLMELYAQAVRRAAVERQYQECVQILETQLGAPPADATTALYEQLQRRPKESDDRLFPAAPPRHNLPAQTTPFVGRETELAKIEELLNDPGCRLLTLVGPGGSGKTRLALEAAAGQLDANGYAYADGVFFVSLAPLEDVDAIVPSVADALGFRFYSGGTPQEQLLNYLRQKHLLLIMDNYEHLLEGVGLVNEMIKTAPHVKILATSRARLNVGGEHRFHVGGMDYPESPLKKAAEAMRYSAVELFTQSARRARRDFQLTNDNLSGVVDLCRLAQGMPLALRLAAGWVEMLAPDQIAAEIRQNIDVLATERRDVPERQRSMRAAFDHSWNLLSEREREIFQTLSIFRGPFTRHATQQVADATLRETRILVDRSLLYPVAEGVYELHELLRQYAAEKLDQTPGASEAARDRHCAYYAKALQGWAADLKGPRSQAALAEIEEEMENLLAAWNWAVERADLRRLDQAIEGLCLYYFLRRRFQDGVAACQSAANHPSLERADGLCVLAKLLSWQAFLLWHMGRGELRSQLLERLAALLENHALGKQDMRLEKARAFFDEGDLAQNLALVRALDDQWWAAELLSRVAVSSLLGTRDYQSMKQLSYESVTLLKALGNQSEAAANLTLWGWRAYIHSDFDEAKRAWQESLKLHRSVGDQWWEAVVLHSLGCAAWVSGDFGRAQQLLEEAIALQRAQGNERGLADSLHQMANVAVYQGRFEQAERLARESIATSEAIGHHSTAMQGYRALGVALVGLGRYPQAQASLEESVAFSRESTFAGTALADIWLSRARLHMGSIEQPHALGRMCLALAQEAQMHLEIGLSLLLLGDVALAVGKFGAACEMLGESLDKLQEIGYRPELGSVLASLGLAALGLGNTTQAREHIRSALRECIETRMVFPLLRVLPAAALLLAQKGKSERAVEVYALASHYPYIANSRWFEDVVGKHIATAAAALPPEVVAAAQERGRARDLWETAGALLDELDW